MDTRISVHLSEAELKPATLIDEQERQFAAGSFGARVDFSGHLRDFNDRRQVQAMYLEHYPGMTERQLQAVCRDAAGRWPLLGVMVHHRVGHIDIGDTIVLVSVWSSHRSDAFDACRWIINELKTRAPFWKQEQTEQGRRWVDGNTPDQV